MMKLNKKGYTLVELMMVVTIMTVALTMIIIPASRNFMRRSKINSAKAQMQAYRTGLRNFRMDVGHFPIDSWGASPPGSTLIGNGLGGANGAGNLTMQDWKETLVQAGPALDASEVPAWKGPYALDSTSDPWGHRYLFMDYSYAGSSVTAIVCQGPLGNNGAAPHYVLGFANTYLPATKTTYRPDRNGFSQINPAGVYDDFNIVLWMK
jgi:prepilin-type N-terminal cleavage/methylation domain-containing protein